MTALLFAALAALMVQRTTTLLTYFQQEEYDNARFLPAVKSVRLYDMRASLGVLAAVLLIALGLPRAIALLLLAAGLVSIAWQERGYGFKKPLAMTDRARRLHRLAAAALVVASLLVFLHPILAIVTLQAAPLALMAANAALQPLQTRINDGYTAEARDKLARLDPVRIGITGSFGKTTVKHMFAEILVASGPVYYSPGSINTILGHTRHIRQRLQWAHKYFVAEMGAYGIGSIQRLCDFIHPNYGIVTAVGDAHTERFGSLENIAKAKSELVADVCRRGGTCVINAAVLDYAPFRELKKSYDDKVITVGPGTGDVRIEAREIDGGAWSITLTSPGGHIPEITYELPLLGAHNVMNSALAVTMATLIDPGITAQIPLFTQTIAQIPHRLQKLGGIGAALILDDAYNSNEIGFISAVSALSDLGQQRGGRRILVTPGIAELGLEHDRVHERLGRFAADKCDVIYAINPARIRAFTEALRGGTAEVCEVSSLAAARAAIAPDLKPEDVILYENDLPDLLEETRLL